ncbi:MAG: flagellar hook-length control protein FliK [Paracoccaceae bacterium]|nr:flagellar hook-length control protein FliK [Paracoccaceae bacterium]
MKEEQTGSILPEDVAVQVPDIGLASRLANVEGSNGASTPVSTAPGAAPTSPPISPPLVPTLAAIARDTGPGTVELTLSPDELGHMRMTLVADGDMLHVTLSADRPETLDLLRRHADQLAQEFRQAGFSGATLSFAQGGTGSSAGSQKLPDQYPVALPEMSALSQAAPSALRNNSATLAGLDLRL